MKKFLSKLALLLLCVIGLAGIAGGASLCVMAGVHDHSVEDEFYNWFPALEKTVDKEEKSKDDEIVIEDEEVEDETQTEENGESTDPVEDPTE